MSPKVLLPVGRSPTSVPRLKETRYSQSLERGLALLGCFTPEAASLGIADMADRTGMSRSTTHRYVITLVKLGYLEQPASGGRKYRLGTPVSDIGMSALNMLLFRIRGHSYLEDLRREVSHTVNAGVLQDGDVVIVDRLRGFRGYAKLKLDLGPGSRLPAYCTSMGKLLLAHLSTDEQKVMLKDRHLVKNTRNTITDKDSLLRELEQIHKVGFAINDEEFVAGVHSIAMPVRVEDLVVGVVDITAPMSMVTRAQLVDDFGPRLFKTTELITASLASVSANDQTAG
jgi:IclR family pca regulon transcriptional regulator